MIKVNYKCSYCFCEKIKFKTETKISFKEFKYIDENGFFVKGKRCYECFLVFQRNHRKKLNNQTTKKYEKTINGFLMRTYRNMKSRVNGTLKLKAHLYHGKTLLDKNEFYLWSKKNSDFLKLFCEWEKNNYKCSITPSIDRIDSSLGYEMSNIRWIEHKENSRNGAISRHRNRNKIVSE